MKPFAGSAFVLLCAGVDGVVRRRPHWPDQPRALPNQETFASEAVLKLLFDFEHAWGRGTLLAVDDPPGPWETRYGVGGSFSCTALLDPRLLRGASCPGMYPSVGSLRSV